MPTHWFRPAADNLVWKTLGEANFVFHPASRQTHFLNQLAKSLLIACERRPSTDDELIDGLLKTHGGEFTNELQESVNATLNVLASLGLIVRQSP